MISRNFQRLIVEGKKNRSKRSLASWEVRMFSHERFVWPSAGVLLICILQKLLYFKLNLSLSCIQSTNDVHSPFLSIALQMAFLFRSWKWRKNQKVQFQCSNSQCSYFILYTRADKRIKRYITHYTSYTFHMHVTLCWLLKIHLP